MNVARIETPERIATIQHVVAVFAAALVTLSVAQAPALWTVFAHHDQYRMFAETLGDPAIKEACEADRQYLWLYKIGRPLTAEIECTIFRHADVPADLTPYRWAVVALQALAAAVFAMLLRACGLQWMTAGALGIGVFLLPGEENAVLMANFANVLTPILALVSHALVEKARSDRNVWPRDRQGFALWIAAWICLAVALHLFSALAVFFFTATFAFVLFRADYRGWGTAISDILFFVSVALPYYLLLTKWYEPSFDPTQAVPWNYAIGISAWNIFIGVVKALYFLSAMLNLWNIYPLRSVFWAGVIVIVWARVSALGRRHPSLSGIGGAGAGRFVLLLVLFGVSSLFVIASPVRLVYRVLLAQTSILLLWLFASLAALLEIYSIRQRLRAQRSVAIAMLALAMILAGWTTTENVFASAMERGYVRAIIGNAPAGSFDQVAIVEPPSSAYGLNRRPMIGDEFNMPSTLGSSNLGSDVPDMVGAVMRELGRRGRPIVDAANPMRSATGEVRMTIAPDDRFEVCAGNGWTSQGWIRRNLVILPMGVIGVLSSDHRTITFNTGVVWRNGSIHLGGTWTSALDPSAITVTRLRAGETPRAPRTLVVDMGKAAFPAVRW